MEFETALEKYQNRRGRTSADSTVRAYTREVRSWHEWLKRDRGKTVWDAEVVDLRIRIRELADQGKAPTTIEKQVSAVSLFYQDCKKLAEMYDMPEVPDNPKDELDTSDKKLLRGDTKKKEGLQDQGADEYPYLEPDKIADLVENVPAPRLRNELIVKMMFNCGFRRGEIVKAKVEHVDREDRSVYIPPRKSPEGRHVPYNEEYLGFQLARWLDHGGRESMSYAPESDYLFPTNHGEHLSGRYLSTIIRDAASNAGLQETIAEFSDGREMHKVTPHTLRHSFAMNCLNSGIDVRKLQTLLGHEEFDTTLIYLQQSKEAAKEAGRMFQPEG